MITGASRPTGAAYESSGCSVVDLSSLDAPSEGPWSIPDGLKGTKSTPSHFIATCRAKASEKGVPRRSLALPLKSSPRALSLSFWPALADGREQALLDSLFIQLLERAYALFEP